MSDENVFSNLVAPILGAVCGNLLSLGPMLSVLEARRTSDLGFMNPTPFPWIIANSFGFTLYGALQGDVFVVASSFLGFFEGGFYLLTAIRHGKVDQLQRIERLLVVLAGVWGVISVSSSFMDQTTRVNLVSYAALVTCMCMFGAPLSTVRQIIATKNAASINRGFLGMQFINCTMWVVYGLVINDLVLTICNLSGLILAISQAGLILLYRSRGVVKTDGASLVPTPQDNMGMKNLLPSVQDGIVPIPYEVPVTQEESIQVLDESQVPPLTSSTDATFSNNLDEGSTIPVSVEEYPSVETPATFDHIAPSSSFKFDGLAQTPDVVAAVSPIETVMSSSFLEPIQTQVRKRPHSNSMIGSAQEEMQALDSGSMNPIVQGAGRSDQQVTYH